MDKKLDKFESFIKESMDSHEVAYDPSAWSSLQKAMSTPIAADGFESFVKNSMDNYEVPYNPASWEAVAKAMYKTPFYLTKWFVGSVAAVLIAGVVVFTVIPSNTNNAGLVSLNEDPRDYIANPNLNSSEENLNRDHINDNHSSQRNNVDRDYLTNNNDRDYIDNGYHDNDVNNIIDHNVVDHLDVQNNNATLKQTNNNDNDLFNIATTNNDIGINESNSSSDDNSTPIEYLANFTIDHNYCEGDKISILANTNAEQVAWYLNGKLVSNDIQYTFNTRVGKQELKLVGLDKNGQPTVEVIKSIHVAAKPSGSLMISKENSGIVNQYSFGLSEEYKDVTWNFGDGEISTNAKVLHTYPKRSAYNLTCTIKNETGCVTKLEKNISIQGYYNIRTEHFFSPDGDGSKDFFLPEELSVINLPFIMSVYNRAGELLFQTNNMSQQWDGRDKNGKLVDFGAYVWRIQLTNELGYEEEYSGTVIKATN